MSKEVYTVHQDEPVATLIDMVVREHIHGAPVLDDEGRLVGVVTQQDIFFGAVTGAASSAKARASMKVREIMTSPAVSAAEDTEVVALCRMMDRLRIHRVPIVNGSRVTGLVSSLDICGAFARGEIEP